MRMLKEGNHGGHGEHGETTVSNVFRNHSASECQWMGGGLLSSVFSVFSVVNKFFE